MSRLLDKIRYFFNKDKETTIFCPHCGAETVAEFFRCRSCGGWIRSLIPPLFSLILFSATAVIAFLWMRFFIPTVATGCEAKGEYVYLYVRYWIYIIRFSGRMSFLVLPPILLVLTYFSFLWRPHRQTGPNLVVTIALLAFFALVLAVMLSFLQFITLGFVIE